MTRSTWNPNSPEALGLEFLGVGNSGYSFGTNHVQRGLRFRAQRSGPIDKLTLYSGPGTNVPTLSASLFASHRFPYIAELIPLSQLDSGGPHSITTLLSTVTTDTNMDRSTGGAVGASDLASADSVGISPTALPASATVAFQDASDFPLDRQVVSVAVEWSMFASNFRAVRIGDRNVSASATPWSRVIAGGVGNWHMGELWVEGGDTTAWHEVTPQMIRQFDTTVGNRRMQLQTVTFNPNFIYDMFRIHIDHFPERRVGVGIIEVAAGVANQRNVLVEIPFHAPGATGTPAVLTAGEEYVLVIRPPYGGANDYSSSSTLDLRAVTDQRGSTGVVTHFSSLDWDWHDVTAYNAGTAQSGTDALATLLTGLPTALFSVTGSPTVDSQPYTRTVGGRVSLAEGEVVRQHNVPNPTPLTEYRSLRFNASLGQTLGGGTGSIPTDTLQVSVTLPGGTTPVVGPFSLAPETLTALGTTTNVDELGHMYFPVSVDFGEGLTLPTLFDVVFTSVTPAERPWRVAVLQSEALVGGDQTYGSGSETYSAVAPVVASSVFTAFSVPATGHAGNLPAVVNPQDLLFAFAGWENGDSVTTLTPSGWTKLSTGTQGPVIFGKVADGTEDGGTVQLATTTLVTGVCVTCRVTGALADLVEGVSVAPRSSGSGTTPNPPSASQPGDWFTAPVRVLAVADWINDDVALSSDPAGYTAAASGVSGGGANNGAGISVAHTAVTAASVDPGPFTIASSQAWAANTLLVRPDPDPGGTPGSFASGRFFDPVASTVDDLNVSTLDDVEFTLFTQAPEVTGVDVAVLAREAHGATCSPSGEAPEASTVSESFNKADGPLGPDLSWDREVYDHEFEFQVVSQRARFLSDRAGTWDDLQVPSPNLTSPDVTVALDVTSFAVSGSGGYVVDARVVSRLQLLEDGLDYRGYTARVSQSNFPFPLLVLTLERTDGAEDPVSLAQQVFLGPGTLTLPGRLTLTSRGSHHTARFTHGGSGPPLEVSAVDGTYMGGVSALAGHVNNNDDGVSRYVDVDNFSVTELTVEECTTCRHPEVTYPRVCWSPSQLPVEDFEFFELQRREVDHEDFETVAVLPKLDPSVTAVGATLDSGVAVTEHPAPSLVAVGDELLVCHWHSWQPGGDYSVSGTDMQPLGTSLRLQGGTSASTPDTDLFNVSKLDVRLKLSLDDWTTPGFFGIFFMGQWPNTPTNNSWVFNISNTGVLSFTFTPDGTTASAVTRTAGVGTGFVDGTVHHVRVTFDGNNGASQNVTRFFISDDGVNWTQLGATSTVAGVVTLPDSSAVMGIGNVLTIDGNVYHAEVRNEVNGEVIASADFHSRRLTDTSFIGTAGNTWTWNGTLVEANELRGPDTSSVTAWEDVEAGSTGTRFAQIAPARAYADLSVLVRGHEGRPVLEEVVTELENDGVTLTTSEGPRRGQWLLAVVGTPAGAADTIGPPTPGNWQLITDSGSTAADRPRVAAWVRPITDDGAQVVRVPATADPFTPHDYHLRVAVLSNVAEFTASCYDDWSVPYGPETCYRVRQGRSDGSVSDWSTEVCVTVPPPDGVDLVFTVPDDPSLNAAYNEAHARLPTEREYTFLDAGDTTFTAVYGRDNQLAFRPSEKRGVRFQRTLLVSPLCAAEAPCLAVVQPLRDLMTAPVPLLVVRDRCGNRWYANLTVSSATQLSNEGLPDLWTAQVQVTELAAPIVGEPAAAEAHSVMT